MPQLRDGRTWNQVPLVKIQNTATSRKLFQLKATSTPTLPATMNFGTAAAIQKSTAPTTRFELSSSRIILAPLALLSKASYSVLRLRSLSRIQALYATTTACHRKSCRTGRNSRALLRKDCPAQVLTNPMWRKKANTISRTACKTQMATGTMTRGAGTLSLSSARLS